MYKSVMRYLSSDKKTRKITSMTKGPSSRTAALGKFNRGSSKALSARMLGQKRRTLEEMALSARSVRLRKLERIMLQSRDESFGFFKRSNRVGVDQPNAMGGSGSVSRLGTHQNYLVGEWPLNFRRGDGSFCFLSP